MNHMTNRARNEKWCYLKKNHITNIYDHKISNTNKHICFPKKKPNQMIGETKHIK